jgi:hypothetical protein
MKPPSTDKKLESETVKWLSKLETKMKSTRFSNSKGDVEKKILANSMENVRAYIKDCRYFMGKKDFVNAFEAIIYAWGIYETLERMGFVKSQTI